MNMTLPETEYLKERLETVDLSDLRYPERLDNIIYESEGSFSEPDTVFQNWVEEAENWDISPRKAVYFPDYWEMDEEVEERFLEEMQRDMDSPSLEGARAALNAVQAQKEKRPQGFSSVIGFKAPALDPDKVQRQQVGAPQGGERPVESPEWYPSDDWFSDLEEDDRVGIIVDDHTVYARHIMDNIIQEESGVRSFDFRFWEGYQETLQNYTGML